MPFGTIAIVSGHMATLQGLIKQRNDALQRGDTELALVYERMINDHCKASIKHLEDRDERIAELEAQMESIKAYVIRCSSDSYITDLFDEAIEQARQAEITEPGAEEGGEDIFAIPDKCVMRGCDGDLAPYAGFIRCVRCGTSYGDAANHE